MFKKQLLSYINKIGSSYLSNMAVVISVPDAIVVGKCSVMAAAVA